MVIEYSGTNRLFLNGVPDNTADGHASDVSASNIGFALGAEWDGSTSYNPLNGDIAELIVYSRALSPAERSSVHRYCAQKYGLAVAA